MKKIISLFIFALLILTGCSFTEIFTDKKNNTSSTETTSKKTSHQNAVIYISVFTHVEQPNSKDTPNFITDENAFWEQRNLVVEFAKMLYEKGIGYSYQPDWTFIEAAVLYDHGTESTNEKNFIQYLYEDLNVSIDPHNHTGQSQYNYADVAYVIKKLGVEPSGVVGGFLAGPTNESILEDFWQPIEGNVYPYTWNAELLWGGATSGHQNEESLWVSGIWKPKDAAHFTDHDNNAPLPFIGGYQTDWDGLDMLLAKQTNNELETEKMYTISINAHQKNLSIEFIEEFAAMIDSYQEYTKNGKIEWVTLWNAYKIWQEEYNSEPNILPYEGDGKEKTSPYNPKEITDECGDNICSLFEKKLGVCSIDCSE